METVDTICNRLNFALAARNMKPVDLSKKTGIPKPSISHYMSGRVEPKPERIYLMSVALGVDPTWLTGFDVPMDIEKAPGGQAERNSMEEQIISIFSRLSREAQLSAVHYLEFLLKAKDNEKT